MKHIFVVIDSKTQEVGEADWEKTVLEQGYEVDSSGVIMKGKRYVGLYIVLNY